MDHKNYSDESSNKHFVYCLYLLMMVLNLQHQDFQEIFPFMEMNGVYSSLDMDLDMGKKIVSKQIAFAFEQETSNITIELFHRS